MARVYADVNQQMPRSYWDYDSVNITWGVLENYEVVRKIGKLMSRPLSHAPAFMVLMPWHRTRKVLGGLRRHQCGQLSKVRYQGPEAGQEEEDQARDQDLAEFVGRPQYRRAVGCGAGQSSNTSYFLNSSQDSAFVDHRDAYEIPPPRQR